MDSVSLYFVGEANELAKLQSPNSPNIGFDEFGDIVIGKDEIVVISGGWEDRNGIYYDYIFYFYYYCTFFKSSVFLAYCYR